MAWSCLELWGQWWQAEGLQVWSVALGCAGGVPCAQQAHLLLGLVRLMFVVEGHEVRAE